MALMWNQSSPLLPCPTITILANCINSTCTLTVETDTPSYYSVLMLNCINGLGSTVFIVNINKFIVAQTPHKMKGLALTLIPALTSVNRIAGFWVYEIFEHHMFPQCGLYYSLTQFLVLCVVMVVYMVVSRWYRLRSRNNPINIYQIVETHVARNIDREEEHLRENGNTILHVSYGTIN